MNEASRLLDGDLTGAELTTLQGRLTHDAALRDNVTAQQLIRDGLAGLRTLGGGQLLRMFASRRRAQIGGK